MIYYSVAKGAVWKKAQLAMKLISFHGTLSHKGPARPVKAGSHYCFCSLSAFLKVTIAFLHTSILDSITLDRWL